MLRSLHIKNYILIDSLDIDFPEGLVIITGQTGAGKSILLGALSLLFGAKADAGAILQGKDSCVVEAEFSVIRGSRAESTLISEDIPLDGDSLVIRRVVLSSGRSRSFVNDCPVTISVLQALSSGLLDIHSQHKSLMITDRDFQLELLDSYCGDSDTLSLCRESFSRLQSLRSEYELKRSRLDELNSEKTYRESQLQQLQQANLREGELEELEEEHKSLANAERIAEALSESTRLLDSDGNEQTISAKLKEASRDLERIAEFLPGTSELSSRIESSRLEIDDVYSELEGMLSGLDMSGDRLQKVEDRMSQLYDLLRRFSLSSVAEMITLRDKLSRGADDLSDLEESLSVLSREVNKEEKIYKSYCATLTNIRKEYAPRLAAEVMQKLSFLELENARFEVRLESDRPSATGEDKLSFLFSSISKEPSELSKVASGGELSRIMLSLKAILAKVSQMPTSIFDEIDTGVSGSVADKMGQMICAMGEHMQVFSITHLPQVAAKGDAHYLVSKSTDDSGRVLSSIRRIWGEEREREIARLLSGTSITDAALANAKSLLLG